MSLKLRIFSLAILSLLLSLSACMSNQENLIIGTWTVTRMDALPGEYPIEEWEFTADYDLIKSRITETENVIMSTGRWGFSKRNRLTITKFDVGFNGEWQIVTFKNNVLRMVLPAEVDGRPAGQVLREFTRSR